jgi:raffinose/stachyose/melibiose transport system permease protein
MAEEKKQEKQQNAPVAGNAAAVTLQKGGKDRSIKNSKIVGNVFTYIVLVLAAGLVFFPLLVVFMNSFKAKLYISTSPFTFPTAETFVGFTNYVTGIKQSDFFSSLLNSLLITVCSTMLILILCSMAAWFLTRVQTWWTKVIYYVIIFSMIVPFQMVMLPLAGVAGILKLKNVWGIILIYVGFGAGLSTFMYSGFVKGVPVDIEESAMIDGCNPLQTFFHVVFPVMKPTTITIAILNVMWIWNDYLLPYQVLGTTKGKTTLPVAIQIAMQGGYGDVNMGGFMAMIVLTIIPVIVFYLFGQKYIIKGVISGAVKG